MFFFPQIYRCLKHFTHPMHNRDLGNTSSGKNHVAFPGVQWFFFFSRSQKPGFSFTWRLKHQITAESRLGSSCLRPCKCNDYMQIIEQHAALWRQTQHIFWAINEQFSITKFYLKFMLCNKCSLSIHLHSFIILLLFQLFYAKIIFLLYFYT